MERVQKKEGQKQVAGQAMSSVQMAKVMGNQAVVLQFADWYAYGDANTLPHIHCYGKGFHLKDSNGHRYNLVQNNIKYPQQIHDAYEWIRNKCAETHREPLLEELSTLFHGRYAAAKPKEDYKPFKEQLTNG